MRYRIRTYVQKMRYSYNACIKSYRVGLQNSSILSIVFDIVNCGQMLSIRKTHDLTHTWIASSFETIRTDKDPSSKGSDRTRRCRSIFFILIISVTLSMHTICQIHSFSFSLSLSFSIIILAFFHITFSLLDSFTFQIHARSHILYSCTFHIFFFCTQILQIRVCEFDRILSNSLLSWKTCASFSVLKGEIHRANPSRSAFILTRR